MVLSRSRSVARRLAALALASCLLLLTGVLAQDTPPSERKCELTVSPGDVEKGLAVVSDARCVNGGDGCIDTICRHCKNAATIDFPTYPSCGDYVDGGAHSSDLTGTDDDNNDGSGEGSGESSGDDDSDLPKNLGANVSVSGGSYGCPYPTSGGDFDAGIQLVGDESCSKGGLGCFAGVCRFCKFRDSDKSNHLVTCDSLGFTIRTPVIVTALPPPNPDTGCPFNISSGDFDVGMQLVGDLSCAGGGLGCYKDVCRFCKFQETPQSSHWLSCSEFGYPRTPEPTFATASFDDDFGEDNGDTGEWDGSTGCAYAVSSGDFAVGVQLIRDASCATGGLGCYGDTCRFCQFRRTLQSSHLLTCAQLGWTHHSPPQQPTGTPQDIVPIADPATGCPFSVSSGDFAAGVQLVGDLSCEKGGLGCFKDVCRFCKFRETPQSTNWVPCANYNYPPIAPPIIQPADVNEPAVDYGTNCPYPVSEGDYAAGVQLVGDVTCDKGGLGCFQDVCRFCKFQETPQSTDYVSCDSLGWPRNVVPVERPAQTPTIDPATECPYPVSSGDFAAGIQLVGDADCVKGGLGCYKNVCRFCQFQETPQSKPYVRCSELGYPRNGATFSPASVDANADTGCSFPVSSGDYDAGIQLVGDRSCDKGGVGCFQDVCRFCKLRSTPQSAAFVNCEDLGYFFGSDADAFVPEPTSTGPSTKCPFITSVGDLAAGILLVGDATCDKGGLGCYQNVCRYCQFVPTEKSNQYVTCASLGYDYALPPLPTMSAPTPAPSPTTTLPPSPPTLAPTLPPCPVAAVSQGDYAVGIQLVGDASCTQGGLGCYQDVCRYCKFEETPQATGWLPCANFLIQPIATPADIVDTPPPPTTPSPPTPAPIVAQVCDRPVSPGDKIAGVGFATDYSCLIAGLGCVKGTVCRLCKVFRSDKSNHLEPCSAYNGVTPTIMVAQPSAAFDPTACAATISVGDTKGGVSAVFDQSCSGAGASVGCFGGVCRYCQIFASEKSKDFLPCPPQAVAASQPTTPGLDQAASAVSPFRAAAKEQTTGFAASLAQFDELFKDRTFQWSLMGAACVGVIAVVALVALGAKRAVAHRHTRSTDAEDGDSDTEESEKLKQGDAPPTPV